MTATGLSQYLVNKRAAMRASAAERPDGADWREEIEATCVADDLTGVRKLRIREFSFVGDSGSGGGGWNLGPTSPELLCGVLSTCVTHTAQLGAVAMEIPLDRVAVRVTALNNDARYFGVEADDPHVPWGIAVELTLEGADADPDALERLRGYVDANCPMLQLVRTENPIALVGA
jgi:uncharacterized OsmC-like protein